MRRRCVRSIAVMLGCLFCVAGCSMQRSALALRVSDASGAAVEGAEVAVAPMSFFLPGPPYSQLTPSRAAAVRALTDASGEVRIDASSEGPSRLTVRAAGFDRYIAIIERRGEGVQRRGGDEWFITGRSPALDTALPQLRVEVITPQPRP